MKSAHILIALAVVLATFSLEPTQIHAQNNYRGEGYMDTSDLLKDRFYRKQRRLLKNKEKLGLSDAQIEQIIKLKAGLEKEMVMKDAQIKVINIDLTTMLAADNINLAEVNQLIDQKYEVEKSKTKIEAKAYADLKSTLEVQQIGVLKNLREIYKGPYNQRNREEE